MDSSLKNEVDHRADGKEVDLLENVEMSELKELAFEKEPQTLEDAIKSTTTTILKIPIISNLNLGNTITTTSSSSITTTTLAEINIENSPNSANSGNSSLEPATSSSCLHINEEKLLDEASSEDQVRLANEKITVDDQNTTTISIVPAISVDTTNPASSSTEEASTSFGKTSRQLFKEKAAEHGGDVSTLLQQQELNSLLNQVSQQQQQAQAQQRNRTLSNNLDVTISRNPSAAGKHEKKIGHRRVDDEGEVTYKKIQSKQIMGSIQLGIQQTVGSLASKPKRDLLMNDFWEIETISFPSEGSSITPAHHYNDFRFKVYAPIAFRYFRDLFGIAPEDFLMSMCWAPLTQLSNPGASGSLFYLTNDDEFIIKTVQKKEGEFLQKLLPGYYMNLSQNPRTLLPKFFGLYCFHYNAKNVRLVAMNNLLPSDIKMHAKYDLKGSTFRRKASKQERQKASPTFKDLDFMDHHPNGIFLETDKYNALMKTIQRDCMVLESFQIMDYSLLMGIHNLDLAAKEKREERIRNARAKLQKTEEIREIHDDDGNEAAHHSQINLALNNALMSSSGGAGTSNATPSAAGTALSRTKSMNRQRLVAHSTAMESITANMTVPLEEEEDMPAGGIPARSENDERLILYIGIIDILQSYRLEKKLEHTFKSIIYNGDTVSVCRPSFYAQRFQNFMGKTVFKKTPTFPLKHSPSKRKTSTVTARTPQRTPSQSISGPALRPITHLSGMSTPPPAFDDISEEDNTATSSTGFVRSSNHLQKIMPQRSYISSNRSVLSSATDDYSDDELLASSSAGVSPRHSSNMEPPRSPRLTKTKVQVTTIGCSEEEDKDDPTDDHDSGNDLSSSTGNQTPLTYNTQNDVMLQKHFIQTTIANDSDRQQLDVNGKPLITSTKQTLVSTQAQTYTSTLVVTDVRR